MRETDIASQAGAMTPADELNASMLRFQSLLAHWQAGYRSVTKDLGAAAQVYVATARQVHGSSEDYARIGSAVYRTMQMVTEVLKREGRFLAGFRDVLLGCTAIVPAAKIAWHVEGRQAATSRR